MQSPPPVLTIQLLPDERHHLLTVLAGLAEEAWQRPTRCSGWSVKDIMLHLLGDDLNALSRLRDRFSHHTLGPADDLVAFINHFNDTWIRGARRLSARVACDLLRWSGDQTYAYFASLDPFVVGDDVVSWAGPDPAPNWLAIAREYTERWVHQQQIREAVGAPSLTDRRLFAPVLATFARALPHTFREVDAPVGTTVSLVIDGDAGGRWGVVRTDDRAWTLCIDSRSAFTETVVRMDQDTAWRLFTKAIGEREADEQVTIEGDLDLGRTVLRTVAILA